LNPEPPGSSAKISRSPSAAEEARLPGTTRDSLAPGFPDAPSRGRRIRAYRLLWGLALGVLVADQLTKKWIVDHIPFNPPHLHGGDLDIEVVRGFFYIIHVGNPGAAWSMFSGQSTLLAVLAGATLLAIFYWRHSLGLREKLAQVCFGLLCGGIVGNLIDRVLYGHVIDFIDLHFGTYVYPTFNVADSGICVGVILYILQSLRAPK
jgi:signal peptidase II